MTTRRDRIEGAMLGLLIGDALGVPYEFHPASAIPRLEEIEMDPPAGFERAHISVPIGTYSDDGALALCLLASLLDRDRLDLDDLARRFCDWYRDGYLAVDGIVFDVGVQTSAAIRALEEGVPPISAGPRLENQNGNGSLMRVLPLALFHRGDDASLVADARLQSRVTHGHLRSQIACGIYVLWAKRTLEGVHDAFDSAVTTFAELHDDDASVVNELAHAYRFGNTSRPTGSGYVVDSLRSAHWACEAGDYAAAMRAAISLGNDTDTTAAIAGGIAGARDGVDAIPSRWRAQLRGASLYRPLLDRLIARVS